MFVARSLEKNPMDLEEIVAANLVGTAGKLERALQSAHVRQHPLGGYVMPLAIEVSFSKPAVGENKALDSGGGNRLGT